MPDLDKVPRLEDLKIKIFSDGADLDSIIDAYRKGVVKGFTTNPTLMSKAGITNYLMFAREVLRVVTDLPVSFEVFSDELEEMRKQARRLAELGDNVYVKIPVTNTQCDSCCPLIRDLTKDGLKLNVTAVFSLEQVRQIAASLNPDVPAIVSVFAGRIADSGRDPIPIMAESLRLISHLPKAELLWASPREALNIVQADQLGCHIITVTPDLLAKSANFGKSLDAFSLETVKMFYNDAVKSGFRI
jgi:transaldolase